MSEPITATPSAPETMRATVLVADATPDLAAGTAPTTASVAGAMTQPIESASPKNQKTRPSVPVSDSQNEVSARSTARPVRPAATTRTCRVASRPCSRSRRPSSARAPSGS